MAKIVFKNFFAPEYASNCFLLSNFTGKLISGIGISLASLRPVVLGGDVGRWPLGGGPSAKMAGGGTFIIIIIIYNIFLRWHSQDLQEVRAQWLVDTHEKEIIITSLF